MKSRVTISDVAKAAGVSNSAVSYALNGKAGVSEQTRDKVLSVASRMGWRPNRAAKALSDASTRTVGLVLTYDTAVLSIESYTMELIAGLTAEFEKAGYSLLVRSSSSRRHELAVLREWVAAGAVDAVLLMNVELGDPRIELFREHPRMPVLLLCDESLSGGLPALSDNGRAATHLVVDYCHGLGHRRIARVAGSEQMGHTFIRDNAFREESAAFGMDYLCLHADYSPESGDRCTRRLLSLPQPPSAIVYDSDVMALAALKAAASMGVRVPDDLSIISWDDSFMCRMSSPGVTALNRDVVARGRKAAGMLIDLAEGRTVQPHAEVADDLIVRGSSAPVGDECVGVEVAV
ncbi:LacI family transcriptional regulator [Bifidobacterium tissieri]|uniref:LacI family transcriptional regulator n=1 Tax=Bifidobacterium tissieri TaxID=1630162 RepID=A0A261FDU4_9BIFI|nr:LacI family DNA-binding transcriptional regulator [Bifidobacterium tissieri]OZG57340.1 LacI family transcriptional regulator [Bifidobacterium tissieri]